MGSYVQAHCADKGLCYPPQVHTVMLEAGASTGGALTGEPGAASGAGLAGLVGAASAESEAGAESTAAAASASGSESNTGPLDEVLRTGKVLPVVGVFFLAGVLLSLTPCVLPMLPILSSIIVGQAPGSATTSPSRWRAFGLAAAYSLGMALVYSALGIAAGLAGEGLGAALQKPGVLVAFALAMGVLALSMFGAYELQLPQAWMARWSRASNRLPGGRVLGVFAMGGLSALIVSPCVAAPLAGALIYISQTRDVVLGGTALFSLAAGMSVPLLLLGASAGAWLPKAGDARGGADPGDGAVGRSAGSVCRVSLATCTASTSRRAPCSPVCTGGLDLSGPVGCVATLGRCFRGA